MQKRIPVIIVAIVIVLIGGFSYKNIVNAKQTRRIHMQVLSMTEDKEFDLTRVIVKYKNVDASPMGGGSVASLGDKPIAQVVKVKQNVNLNVASSSQAEQDTADAIQNVQSLLEDLLSDPNVEYAEPNYIAYTSWVDNGTTTKPNDYNDTNHWYYTSGKVLDMWDDQECATGGSMCGGDSDVIVAVIDTGLAFETYDDSGEYGYTDQIWDYGNNQFYPHNIGVDGGKNFTAIGTEYNSAGGFNIWTNTGEIAGNGKDDDCNGVIDDYNGFDSFAWYDYSSTGYYYPESSTQDFCNGSTPYDYSGATQKERRKMGHPVDTLGHGSFVTGLINGVTNNSARSVSPAHNVTLMPIAANITFENRFYASEVISGIYYATEHDANVINMSLGGFGCSNPSENENNGCNALQESINYAYNNNVVVVAASGNSYSSTVDYPAAFDHVIAVGAVDSDDTRSSYSNYGSALDFVAYVGDGAYQETLTCYSNCSSSNSFNSTSLKTSAGTSFASPQVAAAAALVFSMSPEMAVADVYAKLERTAIDINPVGRDDNTGHGAIDFAAAAANVTPTLNIIEPTGGNDNADESFNITWTDSDDDNDAKINFYFDTDTDPSSKTAISECTNLSEDDASDTCNFHTRSVDRLY